MRAVKCSSLMTHQYFMWNVWVGFCTWFIPNYLLHIAGMRNPAVCRAWKEKMALFIFLLLASAFFSLWLEYISLLFCHPETTYSYATVYNNQSQFVGINGKAVKASDGIETVITNEIQHYLGQDISDLFPKFMHLQRTPEGYYDDDDVQQCIGDAIEQADNWLAYLLENDPGYVYKDSKLVSCPYPDQRNKTGAPCFANADQALEINIYGLKGDIVFDPEDVRQFNALPSESRPDARAYVILDGNVLDMTQYFLMASKTIFMSPTINSRAFVPERLFLPLDVSTTLFVNLGEDVSDYFHAFVPAVYHRCLRTLFFKGIVPSAIPIGCSRINPALWASMGVGLIHFLIKMNLAHLSRMPWIRRVFYSTPPLSMAHPVSWPHTILMIPCYDESTDVLKQTYESLARTNYDDSKKLLLFVCDGLIHHHEGKEIHTLILEALGYSGTEEPLSKAYISLGQDRRKVNYACVYSGFHETGRHRVPFLVVVKRGTAREASGERVPGNRGKRDSMAFLFGWLERCMNLSHHQMNPLEYELFNQCYNVLGLDPRLFKYVLVTDADTQVQGDTLQKLVLRLENDPKMLAISGNVRPANPDENMTTMLQIIPLYLSLFSVLAYEAAFSRVMTISGGCALYKVWTTKACLEEKQGLHLGSNSNCNSNNSSTPLTTIRTQWSSKWPKTSDEIIRHHSPWDVQEDAREDVQDTASQAESMSSVGSWLSLSHDADIILCCVHPTVLRGFATLQASTMHTMNVLLQGEDLCLAAVLLQSHPTYHLGFEPEAIAYTSLPTEFFLMQGSQLRHFRAALHCRLNMQRVAYQLGVGYWLMSVSHLADIIFYMPTIVYLYLIYIRFFLQVGLTYIIVAACFTGLFVLHIMYFLMKRQFRYVLWLTLYCLLAVPLFSIWFPMAAAWCSDSSDRWYDSGSSGQHRGSRLHGIIDQKERGETEEKEEDIQVVVPRLRLEEYEAIEARKSHQRDQIALDSKFAGFSSLAYPSMNIVNIATSGRSELLGENVVSPPAAQLREGHHSTRIATANDPQPVIAGSAMDIYSSSSSISRAARHTSRDFVHGSNPFLDTCPKPENPFDDSKSMGINDKAYRMEETFYRNRHQHPPLNQSGTATSVARVSVARSGNPDFTHQTTSSIPSFTGESGFHSIVNTSGFTRSSAPYTAEGIVSARTSFDSDIGHDRRSIYSVLSETYSIASSSLSIDPEMSLERIQTNTSYQSTREATLPIDEEGRRTAMHGVVSLTIPRSTPHPPAPPNSRSYSTYSKPNTRPSHTSHASHPSNSDSVSGKDTHPYPNPTSNHNLNHTHTHTHNSTSNHNPIPLETLPLHAWLPLVHQEIRMYLRAADLDSITRAQVKEHLFCVFGSRIESSQEIQEFVHTCIEQVTLEYLHSC
ncbi:chitin synthase-domain-containing protein [Spinellus fusiger]|nr:chitin synthase-domain-containing protein [Spinellus fusiger]